MPASSVRNINQAATLRQGCSTTPCHKATHNPASYRKPASSSDPCSSPHTYPLVLPAALLTYPAHLQLKRLAVLLMHLVQPEHSTAQHSSRGRFNTTHPHQRGVTAMSFLRQRAINSITTWASLAVHTPGQHVTVGALTVSAVGRALVQWWV